MATSPVETFLAALRDTHSTGAAVPETSYYGALQHLLNEIGGKLKPKVHCVVNPASTGAGIPDGGLFTAEQMQKGATDLLAGALPARGVIEVKPPKQDAWFTADTAQVTKYWDHYKLVLVTNLRDWLLIGRDRAGGAVKLESLRLAESEPSFWQAVNTPRATAERWGQRLIEFLQRVMLHNAPIGRPQDLAWFLASHAREAKARIDDADLPALDALRGALEQALGLEFRDERGERFFRSTLVQTLFYGVFSAWVLWSKQHPPTDAGAHFEWRMAGWTLHVPMIRALYEQVATPTKLGALHLDEVLDSTAQVLNRVERGAFFAAFDEGQAVQYFYEPFLQAFDPQLRRELGVWYTPPEIVRYQVERVDTVLREELGVADGLADPSVYVLDPCCGTGAYLVEVLRRIERTLREHGDDALVAQEVKAAATSRVFGFELLPAPFVVAHLQLGLLLSNLGAPLAADGSERAEVFMTNALTGWEPADHTKEQVMLAFDEFRHERDAAEHIKQDQPVLVVLGNPPYNSFAGVAVGEERALSDAYRHALNVPQPEGQGLNDLYIRFFRMAERKIVEHTGRGIVCYISNYSWLDGLSHSGMRERYVAGFDKAWIDDLHGDRIVSEYAPDGKSSETVFAIQGTSVGIKVGTAIALLVRRGDSLEPCTVYYADHDQARAVDRRAALLSSTTSPAPNGAIRLWPELGLPFRPGEVTDGWFAWANLPDLHPHSFPGVKTSRDDFLVDVDRDALEQRLGMYFSQEVSHEEMARAHPSAMSGTGAFHGKIARDRLRKRGVWAANILRYAYRPFDVRWLYWEPEEALLDRPRPDYHAQIEPSTRWLTCTRRYRKGEFYRSAVCSCLADLNIIEANVQMLPSHVTPETTLFSGTEPPEPTANVSPRAREYADTLARDADLLWYHTLAVMQSPLYADQNTFALAFDWPRIPLPNTAAQLEHSAALGRQLAALLDPDTPVDGVTTGSIRPELRCVGVVARAGGGQLQPDAGHLDLTAGWGYAGRGGITMPGGGRATERPAEADEAAWGEQPVYDIYLNDHAYWRGVPARVWTYHIGGYQVIKKWLSYREKPLLGRGLTLDEVREVTNMARRLAAIVLLEPELDANYEAVKADTYPWPGSR